MAQTKYGSLENRDEEKAFVDTAHLDVDDVSSTSESMAHFNNYLRILLTFSSVIVMAAVFGYDSYHREPASEIQTEISAASVSDSQQSNAEGKPNFVFFLADDLPWNAIGYQNFDFSFVTPHLSKFANDGIIINNYYAQEICTPSRASLFTGRYPASVGRQYGLIDVEQVDGLNLQETLISEVLKKKGGYTNYVVGKWNLGNSDVRYLPTHRGFDEFFGYLGGGIIPYTKTPDETTTYYDLMYADQECYNMYDGADFGDYTTYLFRNKAIAAVHQHDFDANPMFLYIAYHGVHSPLSYLDNTIDGADIGEELYESIEKTIPDKERQKTAAVMALMDQSVRDVYDAMKERGQEENTYFIFASDNGGCNYAGGFNGPLRGNKGSLFEGGVKVDAMVWGKILPEKVRGTKYDGLMHTSDWFPTMLQLAGITDFAPKEGFELDGISQAAALLDGRTSDFPRTKMLYNVYANVPDHAFNLQNYTQAAVRDERYKLIYTFLGNDAAVWYELDLSSSAGVVRDCSPSTALQGTGGFAMMLFDLIDDPYETTNLYGKIEHRVAQEQLTANLEEHFSKTVAMSEKKVFDGAANWFAAHGNFAQPWLPTPTAVDEWPRKCSKTTVFRVQSDLSLQLAL